MLNEQQIQEALNNPMVEESKIIKGTTVGAFAMLEAAGCNAFSLEEHPQGGYFFFGFNVPEKILEDDNAVIDTHHFKEVIRTLVSKNWKGEVNENSQIGLLKVKNDAGVFEAQPCLVMAESKLTTKQSGRLRR